MTPVQLPEVPAAVAECLVSGEYDDVTYPAVGTYYTAAQLREYATEAVMAERRRVLSLVEDWRRTAEHLRKINMDDKLPHADPYDQCAEDLDELLLTQPEQNSGR